MRFYNNNVHRKPVFFLLGLALILTTFASFGAVANAESTVASISFLEGELALGGEVGGSGLNFNFGQHSIPVATVSYKAENKEDDVPVDHILQVEDSRYDSGEWHVTVGLSNFVDTSNQENPSFAGAITMKSPAIANVNASAGITELDVTNELTILSGGSPELVMLAGEDLPRGVYTATWKNENVALNISDSEVLKISLAEYNATLTWTLNVGPI